jgi:hypothetical protein
MNGKICPRLNGLVVGLSEVSLQAFRGASIPQLCHKLRHNFFSQELRLRPGGLPLVNALSPPQILKLGFSRLSKIDWAILLTFDLSFGTAKTSAILMYKVWMEVASMEQTCKQYSINIPLDDPRVRRIQELGANRMAHSAEEEEELMQLLLTLKKELPKDYPK